MKNKISEELPEEFSEKNLQDFPEELSKEFLELLLEEYLVVVLTSERTLKIISRKIISETGEVPRNIWKSFRKKICRENSWKKKISDRYSEGASKRIPKWNYGRLCGETMQIRTSFRKNFSMTLYLEEFQKTFHEEFPYKFPVQFLEFLEKLLEENREKKSGWIPKETSGKSFRELLVEFS